MEKNLKEIVSGMETVMSKLNDYAIDNYPDEKSEEAIKLEEMYVTLRDILTSLEEL